jgi:very-short-patch-repair endonuclease
VGWAVDIRHCRCVQIAQASAVDQKPPPWTDDLATVAAVVAAGTSYDTVRRRVRSKTWLEPLPGVLCRTTGTPTRRQWMRAALLWLGPSAALSHATAAELWRLPVRRERIVVTTSGTKHPPSRAQVWVRQSTRPFRATTVGGLAVTPAARSVIDACLDLRRLSEVDDLLGRSLQSELATVDDLGEELDRAPSAGSRLPRLAMAELAAGSHAASEAQLMRLIRRAGLPEPELNAAVATPSGTKYVDALWRAVRKGVEVDGQAYHLSPQHWRADLQRQNDIQGTGIILLRIAARRLWTEPDAVIREIRWFLGLVDAA